MIKNTTFSYSHFIVVSLLSVILSACSLSPKPNDSRYSQLQDSAPSFKYGAIDAQEPTPEFVKYNVWTSRPYEINGKFYTPMQTGKGFEESGYASWYGQKFHGHKTANGEIFDMFALTAAHKTLPLPSFVRVTHQETNQSIVVRVNDRGPFHDRRIIDLSYAAAKKLGFRDKGVAPVKIEVIHVDANGIVSTGKAIGNPVHASNEAIAKTTSRPSPIKPVSADSPTDKPLASGTFVQVLAMSDGKKAKDLARGIGDLLQKPTHTPKTGDLYKLRIGPLENEQSAKKVIQDLKNIGFDKAFTIELSAE
ncbi:septal ring lytic transglycosylase RlpA family protein [Agaribacter flavus]|uniref:Endolytic peptidoglycan transglycosylase RlpA n=1 Tax=Agaribacter flavus TaxID=1902781 RepID=A0ABV7FK56_9ALTE